LLIEFVLAGAVAEASFEAVFAAEAAAFDDMAAEFEKPWQRWRPKRRWRWRRRRYRCRPSCRRDGNRGESGADNHNLAKRIGVMSWSLG